MRSQGVSKIRNLGVAETQQDGAKRLVRAGDVVKVRRGGRDRWLMINCPSGCGDIISLNLDPRSGKAWHLYERRNKLTLYPSVWRDSGCKSHFILWGSSVDWVSCIDSQDPFSTDASAGGIERRLATSLDKRILKLLSKVQPEYLSYTEIADRLKRIPWEILYACRRLERGGLIESRNEDFIEYFRRV
jgi:hypothetical protein